MNINQGGTIELVNHSMHTLTMFVFPSSVRKANIKTISLKLFLEGLEW